MRIFVDADAFPNVIQDVLIRASARLNVPLCFVANKPLRGGRGARITFIQVAAGADVADDHIVGLAQAGDLVITADIPLADRVIAKGAFALDPRGKLYTQDNVKDSLAMRDLCKELRDLGMIGGGPATFGKLERQAFANQLDRLLTKQLKAELHVHDVEKAGL
ncbi:MAG: YaiI/YqxD family protein [Syntrophobacterales bacterium]|nr:YaiI/YqxD family protein [Syntrophobacterales bacterium]